MKMIVVGEQIDLNHLGEFYVSIGLAFAEFPLSQSLVMKLQLHALGMFKPYNENNEK